MKKVLKYIIMTFGVLFILLLGSCVALVSCTESEVDEGVVVDDQGVVPVIEDKNELYNQLVQDIEWKITTDEWGDTEVVGILENTTGEKIDYIEIDYKFILDDVTVDRSWTCEAEINPGEKVRIEIWTFEEFDEFIVTGSTGWE